MKFMHQINGSPEQSQRISVIENLASECEEYVYVLGVC